MHRYAKVNYVKIGYREKTPRGGFKFMPLVAVDRILDSGHVMSAEQFENLCKKTAIELDKIIDKPTYIQEMVED